MGALTLQKVRKSYGSTHILKEIDISIEQGEFLILVGPSGCGKSTLLSMIAGLDSTTSGRILIGDRDVTHLPSKDRDIAMVFQSYALYPTMTVAQNVTFGLEMRGVPKPRREEALQRVAKMLQIGHLLDRKPGALSGGQRQRVAMGRALARNPKLFLFDEPLSNLDAKLRVEMRAEIKQLHQRTRTTTVYVTHDQVEAMTLGDRIAVMKEGVIEQFGTPAEIYGRPASRFVAEFIGSPAMNLLPAQWQAGALMSAGHALPLPPDTPAHVGSGTASELLYGIRPEELEIAADGLPGRVILVEPTGPETYVGLDTPAGRMTARLGGTARPTLGETLHWRWAAGKVHLFDGAGGRRLN